MTEYGAIGGNWCELAALDGMEGVINNLMQWCLSLSIRATGGHIVALKAYKMGT